MSTAFSFAAIWCCWTHGLQSTLGTIGFTFVRQEQKFPWNVTNKCVKGIVKFLFRCVTSWIVRGVLTKKNKNKNKTATNRIFSHRALTLRLQVGHAIFRHLALNRLNICAIIIRSFSNIPRSLVLTVDEWLYRRTALWLGSPDWCQLLLHVLSLPHQLLSSL